MFLYYHINIYTRSHSQMVRMSHPESVELQDLLSPRPEYPPPPRHGPSLSISRKGLSSNSTLSHTIQRTRADTPSTRGLQWWLEYSSLAISASALAALITLLTYIDDLPLSQWTLSLSPTTLVSILAGICRTVLAFPIASCIGQAKWNLFKKRPGSLIAFDRIDDASRGPWGSFWLIISIKPR